MANNKNQFKNITEADIQELTDLGSFRNGRSYYNSGRVYDMVLREGVLKARCEGSQNEAYFVQATLIN